MILHALQDDFSLNALGDVLRDDVLLITSTYLTDQSGNYLTDQSGNRLMVYESESVSAQRLHALQDDFILRAE